MGRPREFDREHALQRAVDTFWQKGYSGTSVQDLVDSMGIHRASLYDTYGSKKDLFREVLERYSGHIVDLLFQPIDVEVGAREQLRRFFVNTAEAMCGTLRRGCLMVKTIVGQGEELPAVRELALVHSSKVEGRFAELLAYGKERGEFPPDLDIEGVAHYLRNSFSGMWITAAIRDDPEQLRGIVDWTLRALD